MKKVPHIFLLLLLVLSACSSTKEDKDYDDAEEVRKEEQAAEAKRALDSYKPKLICPQVAIIHELEGIQDFGDDPPGVGSLIAEARMQSVEGTCSYQDTGIDVAFTLKAVAAKGPKFRGDLYRFPYFVAVLDPDDKILNKNEMTVRFDFKSSEKLADKEEPLHVFIPLNKEKKAAGPEYRVLTGFQLTEEQLAHIRGRKKQAEARLAE